VASIDALAGAPLLPQALRDKLRTSAAAVTADPNDPGANADGIGGEPTGTAAEPGEEDLPVMGIVGLAVLGGGLAALVGGAAVAVAGNDVLLDGSASADDKAQAQVYGPIAIGVAVVGGVVTLVGAGVAAWGLAVEG
jgi:hypothetical protein